MSTPKITSERLLLRAIRSNDFFGYYSLLSNNEIMESIGGPTSYYDQEKKDVVAQIKNSEEQNISLFWVITLNGEDEFLGYIKLVSYNSVYFDQAFSALGEERFSPEFLRFIDKINGWELDYALLKTYHNMGIMKEAVGLVLDYCFANSISPIYARIKSLKNHPSLKILSSYMFKPLMPLFPDISVLERMDLKTIIAEEKCGFIYVKK